MSVDPADTPERCSFSMENLGAALEEEKEKISIIRNTTFHYITQIFLKLVSNTVLDLPFFAFSFEKKILFMSTAYSYNTSENTPCDENEKICSHYIINFMFIQIKAIFIVTAYM